MQTFTTHLKENVNGERLKKALEAVADEYLAMAYAIKKENAYGSHITERQKEQFLKGDIAVAETIRNGTVKGGFWLWQRINEKLTGECVALLPK